MQKCEWFYDGVKRRFKRFGSHKVMRAMKKSSLSGAFIA